MFKDKGRVGHVTVCVRLSSTEEAWLLAYDLEGAFGGVSVV